MSDKKKRVYINMNEAWWAVDRRAGSSIVEEICLSPRDDEGDTIYEFMAEWHALPDPTLRICVFEDAFDAYADFADLFRELAEMDRGARNMNVDAFCALLKSLGIEDATPRKRPADAPAPVCPTCHRALPEHEP